MSNCSNKKESRCNCYGTLGTIHYIYQGASRQEIENNKSPFITDSLIIYNGEIQHVRLESKSNFKWSFLPGQEPKPGDQYNGPEKKATKVHPVRLTYYIVYVADT
jgi:hypothetical protein